MKKLFLASVVTNVIDSLVEFVGKPPNKMTVAFIPTAADPYENKSFVEEDKNALKNAGFNIIDVDIKEKTKKDLVDKLGNVDVIFVAGGNTFYLLQKVIESGLDKILKDLINNGKIYVGSSAGAVLVGPSIEPVASIDDLSKAPLLKSFKGLNLVDFVVLPHYGDQKYKAKFENISRNFGNKYKLVPITNQQAILVQGNSYHIVKDMRKNE